MSIVWMILLGLIAGSIAKLLMPGKDPGGWIVTALLGIAGSIVGGFVFGALGITGGGPSGLIGSIVGAMILLGAYRLMKRS